MDPKNVRAALKTARLARRSWRGAMCPKGFGKRAAGKADRRVSKALCRAGGG